MAEVSVPVLGVIFLSAGMMYYDEKKGLTQFPSPYWELFLSGADYNERSYQIISRFPSPY